MTDLERRLAEAILCNHVGVGEIHGDRYCLHCNGEEYLDFVDDPVRLDDNFYHESNCIVVECARLLGVLPEVE